MKLFALSIAEVKNTCSYASTSPFAFKSYTPAVLIIMLSLRPVSKTVAADNTFAESMRLAGLSHTTRNAHAQKRKR